MLQISKTMKSSNMTSSTTIYQVYHGNNSKWGNHSMYNKTFTPNRQSINSNREFVPYLNERDGMNRLLFKKGVKAITLLILESPRSVPMSPATSDLFRRTSSFRKTEQHNTEGKTIDWGSFKFVPTVIHCPSKVSLRKIISLANMPSKHNKNESLKRF